MGYKVAEQEFPKNLICAYKYRHQKRNVKQACIIIGATAIWGQGTVHPPPYKVHEILALM